MNIINLSSMISGQNPIINEGVENGINPQKMNEYEEIKQQGEANCCDREQTFPAFGEQSRCNKINNKPQYERQSNKNKSNEMEIECQGINGQQQQYNDESRPSPIDQSCQNSNNSKGKNKSTPLSNELLRLTKKPTTTSKKQKKVRYYVTDFEPYLPSFLDHMHRESCKTIIRIGEDYQAKVDPFPKFQSLKRPMAHLRVWKGCDEPFDEEVYRRFKQIFGDYRTEEELILLKNRLRAETWSEVMKEVNEQKQQGKKQTLHIQNNHMNGTMTRIK